MQFCKKLIMLLTFACGYQVRLVTGQMEVPSLGQCLKGTTNNGLLACAGQQALYKLQDLEDAEQFNLVEGVAMVRDDKAERSLANFLDKDPMDFRSMLENAGAVFGQRSLQWDMGTLYPGLTLRVGPSVGGINMLEFIMDTNLERHGYPDEEQSTARTITKQFIVPFLLGLKFNLATLLPLIFGALIVLSKKALILGKIALLVSGVFGLGSFFSPGSSYPGGGLGGHGGYHGYHGYGQGGYGGGGHGGNYFKDVYNRNEKALRPQTANQENPPLVDNFYKYEDQLYFHDRLERLYDRIEDVDPGRHRNFAWQTATPPK